MDITTNILERSVQLNAASQIVKFYEDRSIFITGVTGYLGQSLVEKILFSCINIKKVYVLMKQKKEKSIDRRLAQMLESPLFQRIKEQNPNAIKKIVPIKGNLVEHNLGLSKNDINLLQKEVSVVFHLAANISFNVELPVSINTNTRATEKLINICKQMSHLTAFVYVSTAFSQMDKSIVDEICYDPVVPVERIYDLIEIPNSKKIQENLLEGRPNTYTYSKALSEEIIRRNADQIPAAIVRPSQILSAVKEPMPGWISSVTGPSVIVKGASQGLWFCWNGISNVIVDLVPVDYVANLIIAAAWDTHNRRVSGDIKKEKTPKVFNYSSSVENPIKLGSYMSMSLDLNNKIFGKETFFTNRLFFFRKNFIAYWMITLIFHTFFANVVMHIIDAVYWLTGRDRIMVKFHQFVAKMAYALQLFTQKNILFFNGNVRRLYQSLNGSDKELFDFDISRIVWEDYLRDYVVGMKKYSGSRM